MIRKRHIILGIETSCDDTGIAVYDETKGLLTHQVIGQYEIHRAFKGIVPELASRNHSLKIGTLIEENINKAGLSLQNLTGIAYCQGPGLISSLLVGANIGQSLGFLLNIPTLGVNHLEAHVMCMGLENALPPFPFISLLVSGGHSLLFIVHQLGQYEILGQTLDDAAGEAFDKGARLLDCEEAHGRALSMLATKADCHDLIRFPRPLSKKPNFDFSFSGLKTSLLHAKTKFLPKDYANLAYAFEEAIVDSLLIKTKKALKSYPLEHLVIAGGVSANQMLRQKFKTQLKSKVHFVKPELCTDNGAMIAYTGALYFMRHPIVSSYEIDAFPQCGLRSSLKI